MKQLIEIGHVERGFLGVELDGNFDSASARYVGLTNLKGARVKQVTDNSPASLANLQVDDVILMFDGLRIEDEQHLINLVKRTEIGRKVEMVIFRDRETQYASVRIGKRKDFVDKVEQP